MNLAQNLGQGIPTIREETLAVADRLPEIIPGTDNFTVTPNRHLHRNPRQAVGDSEDGLILVTIWRRVGPGPLSKSPSMSSVSEKRQSWSTWISQSTSRPVHGKKKQGRSETRLGVGSKIRGSRGCTSSIVARLFSLLSWERLFAPAKPLVVYYFEGGRYEARLYVGKEVPDLQRLRTRDGLTKRPAGRASGG